MHRFFLPPEECREEAMRLTGREAHHGIHVLRLRRGDAVIVLDGAGHEYRCEVSAIGRDTLELAVRERLVLPRPACRITLVQALPKGKIMDAIVQKATELGAARIVTLLTDRVISQLDEDRGGRKVEHWRQVAIEAVKQCGLPWLPQIEAPTTIREFLSRDEPCELPLIAALQGASKPPRFWFEAFQREHGRRPQTVQVWVGPEGDFTPEELAAVQAAGARPVTLGRNVLRVETAAIYCLSVAQHEVQAGGP